MTTTDSGETIAWGVPALLGGATYESALGCCLSARSCSLGAAAACSAAASFFRLSLAALPFGLGEGSESRASESAGACGSKEKRSTGEGIQLSWM